MAVEVYKSKKGSLRMIVSASAMNPSTLFRLVCGQLSFDAQVGIKATLLESGLVHAIQFMNRRWV